MEPIMSDKDLPVKEERNTIVRVVHNRENPFVQLNKQALWDPNLSLKAIGLWARCMSRPNDWKFSIKELVGKCKEGRRAVDSAMQELIKANYACRLEYSERGDDGKFNHSGVEYVFFEFPATEEEKATQLEIFKKSYRNCGYGDCRYGDCRNSNLLIKSLTETDAKEKDLTPPIPPLEKPASPDAAKAAEVDLKDSSKEKPKRTRSPSDFTPKVKELADNMVNALHQANPHWLIPKNLHSMMTQIEEMITKEKRTAKDILDVFMWAVSDHFWMDKLCKPNPAKYLREQFGQLAGKMNAKPAPKERKFAPSSNDQRAIEIMEEMARRAL